MSVDDVSKDVHDSGCDNGLDDVNNIFVYEYFLINNVFFTASPCPKEDK